jgi:hypothetical protein
VGDHLHTTAIFSTWKRKKDVRLAKDWVEHSVIQEIALTGKLQDKTFVRNN